MSKRAAVYVICFDCGGVTGNPMLVRRVIGDEPDDYEITTYVHRPGTGCHKGMDAHTVRFEERGCGATDPVTTAIVPCDDCYRTDGTHDERFEH